MITSISIKSFKSYSNAELVFAPLTLFIGANASGKSNALEAIRLLSWLAKGSRLDDIERNIQGADSLVRGLASNLFRYGNQQAEIGCRWRPSWKRATILPSTVTAANDEHVQSGLWNRREKL